MGVKVNGVGLEMIGISGQGYLNNPGGWGGSEVGSKGRMSAMKRNRTEVAALAQMCRGISCAEINCGHLRKSPAGLSTLKQRWNSVFRELFFPNSNTASP